MTSFSAFVFPSARCVRVHKEISDYGAHNQRGYVTISKCAPDARRANVGTSSVDRGTDRGAGEIRLGANLPLLKRTDERHVTMQAYDNPVFVEDVVRNVARYLQADERITWFEVRVVNQKSIHNHSAFAVVRMNGRGRSKTSDVRPLFQTVLAPLALVFPVAMA